MWCVGRIVEWCVLRIRSRKLRRRKFLNDAMPLEVTPDLFMQPPLFPPKVWLCVHHQSRPPCAPPLGNAEMLISPLKAKPTEMAGSSPHLQRNGRATKLGRFVPRPRAAKASILNVAHGRHEGSVGRDNAVCTKE